jgi:hypothetical protein
MITLEKTHTHTPHMESISYVSSEEAEYTFCEDCEQNIDRFYIDGDDDRLGRWSQWRVTK